MAAAIAAIRRALAALDELPAHPGQFVALAAAETQSISVVAMQLDHVFWRNSGALMEIVDVLRDHGRRLAGAVEARERKVSAARPGGGKLRVHGEAPPPSLVAHLLAGEELVEGDRLVLGPQPAGRAEGGDGAFGRDAGTGERADDGG